MAQDKIVGSDQVRIALLTKINNDIEELFNTISAINSGTFIGLTDTPDSYTAGQILFMTASEITGDSDLQWDNTNKKLTIGSNIVLPASGNILIGTTTDNGEKLQINGAILLGNSAGNVAGTIRWTGSDFEGYDGSAWKSLTTSSGGAIDNSIDSVIDDTGTNINLGTSWANLDATYFKLDLPAAGDYLIYTSFTLRFEEGYGDSGAYFRLYNNTDSTVISNSERRGLYVVDNTDNYINVGVSFLWKVSVSGAKIIYLQGYADQASAMAILIGSNYKSEFGYIRIS